jgi:hypothetical protein
MTARAIVARKLAVIPLQEMLISGMQIVVAPRTVYWREDMAVQTIEILSKT